MKKESISRAKGSAAPELGPPRPAFGMVRDQGRRIEVTFSLKNGGMLSAVDHLDQDLTAELLQSYADQLAKDVAASATRTFTDAWAASGQRAWINLGEVVAFSARPAK